MINRQIRGIYCTMFYWDIYVDIERKYIVRFNDSGKAFVSTLTRHLPIVLKYSTKVCSDEIYSKRY